MCVIRVMVYEVQQRTYDQTKHEHQESEHGLSRGELGLITTRDHVACCNRDDLAAQDGIGLRHQVVRSSGPELLVAEGEAENARDSRENLTLWMRVVELRVEPVVDPQRRGHGEFIEVAGCVRILD